MNQLSQPASRNLVFEFRSPNAASDAQRFLQAIPTPTFSIFLTGPTTKRGLRVTVYADESTTKTVRQLAKSHGAREIVQFPPRVNKTYPKITTTTDGTRVVAADYGVDLHNGGGAISMTLPALREALAFAEKENGK